LPSSTSTFSTITSRNVDRQIVQNGPASSVTVDEIVQGLDAVDRDEIRRVPLDSILDLREGLSDALGLGSGANVRQRGWGVTTLLVGEYVRDDFARFPEFAIADGIVHLTNQPNELTSMRQLEVHKLRGTDYVGGRHFFEMSRNGIVFYPRVRMPQDTSEGSAPAVERLSTGVAGLDELLGGGLPARSATFVQGSTGTGKTLLGLHFLVAGAQQGEAGILFTLEETFEQLRGIAASFGWNLQELERQGRLRMNYTSPVELSTDRFLHDVREQVETLGVRRLVLDSLTSARLGANSTCSGCSWWAD
jgi:circadian clock protein KaiC